MGPRDPAALLEVRDVSVRFGGVVAVDGASFTAEAGRVTGLIGPNGAGKTTTFDVICGLQPPSAGRVLLDGRDITTLSTHQRARLGVARTFQRLEAFGSLSVLENVLTAAEVHRRWRRSAPDPKATAQALVHRVGVAAFAHQQADSVPTGAARLLELGRALAIQPRLLLLDEPSSGLGEEETEDFGRLVRGLATDGAGVLLVEHDMDLVMSVCDVVHVLDFGRVIASGTPDQVRTDPGVREAYLGTAEVAGG